jgi:hypothetical protein
VSRFALLVTIISVLGLVAAACGGGSSESPLERYLRQLDESQEWFSGTGQTIAEQYPRALEDVEQTRGAFTLSAGSTRDFRDALKSLEPPEALRASNDEAIAALDLLAAAQQAVADELVGVTDLDGMQAVLDRHEAESRAAFERLNAACREGQAVADAEGIDVALDCPEEEAA